LAISEAVALLKEFVTLKLVDSSSGVMVGKRGVDGYRIQMQCSSCSLVRDFTKKSNLAMEQNSAKKDIASPSFCPTEFSSLIFCSKKEPPFLLLLALAKIIKWLLQENIKFCPRR
jgi:hypothetical protein